MMACFVFNGLIGTVCMMDDVSGRWPLLNYDETKYSN
jgi:hypothetical protein